MYSHEVLKYYTCTLSFANNTQGTFNLQKITPDTSFAPISKKYNKIIEHHKKRKIKSIS